MKKLDVAEEALCFGWIDSTCRIVDGTGIQRLSPRRRSSHWTELNRERCRRLERLGLMTEAGRRVLPDGEFRVEEDILAALRADPLVWRNYLALPDLYRRVRIGNIQSKRGTALFAPRLEKFIENTRKGILYGEWNDGGRLSSPE